jgi:AraC family ethanolamine operon transcriptional activator
MRDRALQRALSFIGAMAEEPFTIRDLCREAGASERTLQYAFQDYFGLSPKRYVNAFRLDTVRRKLLAADPSTTSVGDVAGHMGFWHSGQFAATYLRFCGELPSETLKRPVSA